MITQVRSASIHDGKIQEAFEIALRVRNYVNESFGTDLRVARNITGTLYQVHWIMTADSLAAWENLWRRVEADEGYQAILAEVRQANVFIGTSVEDRLYDIVG